MPKDIFTTPPAPANAGRPVSAADKTPAQALLFANRLRKRFRHLAKWAKRTGVGAFRLYDRDIPEIPLVLDYYGDPSQPGPAALAGALYQRPYEKDEAEETRWLEAMRAAAAEALGIEPRNIFLKRRERQRGRGQYAKIGERRFEREVAEGGLVFRVNLSDYLDTGLFLDRRLMRARVREEARGKRVLNLFCYTASFSVYAAAGGAALTDSVDLSNTYLEWARVNFNLNGLSAAVVKMEDYFQRGNPGAEHRLIRADVFAFLDQAADRRWDLIILDPPAFSNSKKMRFTLDLKRDHAGLIARCLGLLAPGGKLWFSANPRSFALDAAALEAELAERFPGVRVTDPGKRMVDEDFTGRKTPKNWVIENAP